MCASWWLMPTYGQPVASAIAFAALTPTSNAPARPGPCTAATASISPSVVPASSSASPMTSLTSSRCARDAISGTTPPYRACRSTWLDTTDDCTNRPSSTTAAAVSSHEVSIPRMRMVTSPAVRSFEHGGAGHAPLEAIEQRGVVGLVHLVGPHDQRVLAAVGVVALAHTDRGESESLVEPLRAVVREPYLQRECVRTPSDSFTRER